LKYLIAALSFSLVACSPAPEPKPEPKPYEQVVDYCIDTQRTEIDLGRTQLQAYDYCKNLCVEQSDNLEMCLFRVEARLDLIYSSRRLKDALDEWSGQ
jgi:hypothetical protein